MTPAIELNELTKRFRPLWTYRDLVRYAFRRPEFLAVDRVSLRVEPGEVFGVLGPNGAGKTTLLRMLSTGLVPSSGTARVGGFDVVREASRVRQVIGLVGSEERSFFPQLTGRQNLEFFGALYGLHGAAARKRIDALLERVGLDWAVDRPFSIYSTGMRQRLAIVRGLLSEPQVLFLDEPTRALDPIAAREVRQLIAEHIVGELGRTVILATNQMAEAEELCDRLALIRLGRVVSEGTVDELRRSLRSGVRCELQVRDLPPGLPDALRLLSGVLDVAVENGQEPALVSLTLSEEGPVLAAALRETIELGGQVYGCTTRRVSLEEIFVDALADRPAEEVAAC